MRSFLYLIAGAALLAAAAAGERRVDVSSDEVVYSTGGEEARFIGNVQIKAGGLRIDAATLRVQSGGGQNVYTADGGGRPIALFCDDCADYAIKADIGGPAVFSEAAGRLQLDGRLEICAGEDCRQGKLQAERADWQRQSGRLQLTGAPVSAVWQLEEDGAPLHVQADDILYHLNSGEAVLTGSASLRRDAQNITGKVIHLNTKTGALRAEAEPGARVQATFGGDD